MPRAKRERKRALSQTVKIPDSSPKKTKLRAPDCERSWDESFKQAEDSRDGEGTHEDIGSAVSSVEPSIKLPKSAEQKIPEDAAGEVEISTEDTIDNATAASPADLVGAPLPATTTRAGNSAKTARCKLSRLGDLPPEVGVQVTSKVYWSPLLSYFAHN
jgi:hypothetical protein